MKLLFSLSVLLSLASSNLAGLVSSAENTKEEKKNYIVKVTDPQAHRSLSTSSSHEILRVFKHGNLLEMRLDKAEVRELMDSDDVLNIEEDQPVYLSPTYPSSPGDMDASIGENPAEVPYGIQMVQALDVADDEVGSSGITVCIADTGYDILQNDLPQGSKVDGQSFIDGESWSVDGNGHGTHVAGTIAALENGLGVLGVVRNGEMNLLIAKVLSDSGSGSTAGVLAGVEWCQENGADVINMSLGGGGFSQIDSDFYREIYENDGVLIVAAAGNSGPGQVGYPASYDSVLSVGAVDSNKNIAGFSQTNDQVELVAPGVAVKSTQPNNSYVSWSGTSMACPHVAGVAALVWSHFPYLTAMEIRNVLRVTAENLGNDEGKDPVFGYGLVRAKDAFDALHNDTYSYFPTGTPTLPPPTTSPTECDGVDLTVTLLTDNYGYEVSWIVTKDGLTILSSDGETYGNNQQYVSSTCVPAECDGDYTFSIFDSYGDGLYSPGSYTVTMGGVIKAEGGGAYGYGESKVFSGDCDTYSQSPSGTPTLTTSPTESYTPTASPNPSSSPSVGPTVDSVISFCGNGKTKFAVDINTDYYPGNESWELWDACGDEEILAGEFQPEDRDIEYHFETCVDLDARYKFIVKNPVGFENDGPGSPFVLKFDNHIIESRYDPVFREGIVTYFGTKENCCGQEEKNLQVEINSDAYPEQTSWKVMNACTNATVAGGTFDDNQQYYEYAIEKCLKENDTYKFVIEDSNGDGIGYDYDDDDYNDYYYEYDYKVIYDGVQVTAENAQFKDDKDESPNFGSTKKCKSPKSSKSPKATKATKAPKLRKRKF